MKSAIHEILQNLLKVLKSWPTDYLDINTLSLQCVSLLIKVFRTFNNLLELSYKTTDTSIKVMVLRTLEFFHNHHLIRWIKFPKCIDLTKDWTQIACLGLTITIECFLCLCDWFCLTCSFWTDLKSSYNIPLMHLVPISSPGGHMQSWSFTKSTQTSLKSQSTPTQSSISEKNGSKT